MSLISKRSILRFLENKRFTSLWNEAEQLADRQFVTVEDLLRELITTITANRKPEQDNGGLLERIDNLSVQTTENEGCVSQFQSQHGQKILEKETFNNQAQKHIEVLDEVSEKCLRIYDLTERVTYDKHLTLEDALHSVQSLILPVLNNLGIQIIDEINIPFDASKHNAITVTLTDNPDLNDYVAESLRPGIIKNGECVQAQDVIVYKYTTQEL